VIASLGGTPDDHILEIVEEELLSKIKFKAIVEEE